MESIEVTGLYELDKALDDLVKKFPQMKRELHEKAADIMWENVTDNIYKDVYGSNLDYDDNEDTRTGNLLNGQDKVVGSGGGYAVVRPNPKVAPHTHLLDEGHKIVVGRNPSKWEKRAGAKDTRKVVGFVNGKHFYKKAILQSAPQLIAETEKLANEVTEVFL